jgi:hypothetical protein
MYASLFGKKLDKRGADVWLVNTGWVAAVALYDLALDADEIARVRAATSAAAASRSPSM